MYCWATTVIVLQTTRLSIIIFSFSSLLEVITAYNYIDNT